ncbi:hypothetical protein [Enterococcus hulanensis]|uniref:hypothetical protein n=1 Tax=Enterococcus hulanensis TaxID=2559929 RepID=UPI003BF4E9AE
MFEFNRDDQRKIINITYRQEELLFINYYECRITKELTSFQVKKLWIIDDQTHQPMLLPDEY